MADQLPVPTATHLRAQLGVYTPAELASVLDVTPETLTEWRYKRVGPDYVKLGKGVMYRAADVEEWMRRNVVPVTRT